MCKRDASKVTVTLLFIYLPQKKLKNMPVIKEAKLQRRVKICQGICVIRVN